MVRYGLGFPVGNAQAWCRIWSEAVDQVLEEQALLYAMRPRKAQGETMLSPEVFTNPTIAEDSGQCREWLDRVFTYHAPQGDDAKNYISIRDTARHLAEVILDRCPPSPDRAMALRTVREAVMWANASIATRVRPEQPEEKVGGGDAGR